MKDIDITLTFNEILNVCACDRQWLLALIEEGVMTVDGDPEQAIFSGFQMGRIRRAGRIGRDFEASVPALGLILQLLDEVEELRKGTRPIAITENNS